MSSAVEGLLVSQQVPQEGDGSLPEGGAPQPLTEVVVSSADFEEVGVSLGAPQVYPVPPGWSCGLSQNSCVHSLPH